MDELLEILERNGRISIEDAAMMLGKKPEDVREQISDYEKENIIIGYNTIINWDKTNIEKLTAMIEVKITPQRGEGFDKIAERIYKFHEVKSCYLMSGGYDLCVTVEGKSMKEIALFVAEKLAPIESVLSTATHFTLKKYKDNGVIFSEKIKDDREAIFI